MSQAPSRVSVVAPVPGSRLSLIPPSVVLGSSVDAENTVGSRISAAAPSIVASSSLPALPSRAADESDEAKRRLAATLARASFVYGTTYTGMSEKIPKPAAPRTTLEQMSPEEPVRTGLLPWDTYQSSYRTAFVDHKQEHPQRALPHENPYIKSKAEQKREWERNTDHWKGIEKARRKERMRMEGTASEVAPGKLTAALKPPKTEVHYNYVGGPPPALWRSDYRGNLVPTVHGWAENKRMAQPTKLAITASPISGITGIVGDPNC